MVMKKQVFFPVWCMLLLLKTIVSFGQTKNSDVCDDKNTFITIQNWISTHKGTQPETPVPPVIDPDCHDCMENNYTDKNKQIIDDFMHKSVQPEEDMIINLLHIIKDKTIRLGGKFNASTRMVPSSYDNENAYPCLSAIDDRDLQRSFDFLVMREKQKIDLMIKKFEHDGDYFIGGVIYYFNVLRDLEILGYEVGSINSDKDLITWANNYYEKYKDRLLNHYQYQLYPKIFYIPHEMSLLGVDLSSSKIIHNNGHTSIEKLDETDAIVETWNKAISLMHFKLKISYSGDGSGEENDKAKVSFEGETEIRCRVVNTEDGPCYTWEPENGKTMTFKIEHAEFHDYDKGVFTYAGPKEFNTPVQFNVNMCNKEPVFRMIFDRLWPENEVYNSPAGVSVIAPMLNTLVSATLSKANIESIKKESKKFSQAESQYNKSDMEAWNKRMELHRNDRNYFKTAQGKKDLAIAKNLQKQYGSVSAQDQNDMNQLLNIKDSIEENSKSNPNYTSSPEYFEDMRKLRIASGKGQQVMQNFTGGALTLNKLELPFKIGSPEPVNGTIGEDNVMTKSSLTGGAFKFSGRFKVELINFPDNRDNIKNF